ncbi:hypothetical protein SCLCIDRAFT_26840 [Scleroderma citrinum Foug A]|uniref:Uncharacterized protein n=1 Tax=Scleroderma citrinum Foug A TaxID=1036808 RepID=A0A0C3DVI3_9AGAM|nr:hypothetical protein SCLCIDRAFT_26840 [Scleroderma citrinum Foug A]
MSTHPIDWSKVPHTDLVSDSEDDAEVAEAKAGEKQRREEEVKAERQRQMEAQKVEEVRRAEEAQRVEEEHQAEMRVIDEAWVQMEQEQQEEMQAQAWAITVTQGSGTPGSSTAVAVPIPRVCERCTLLLKEPKGCMVREKGKARACLLCQKVCKACVWPLGLVEATVVTGSGMEGSRRPALRHMVKWRTAMTMNTSPRGGEKHKKARTTTEEGEDDENTEEVFRVPRVMAEEQCNMLGMLTQALAQVAERMAAAEARDEERLTMEREMMEIQRAHLAMARRAADCEEERLELERVQLSIAQHRMEDLWKMGTLMRSPFVYSSKGKERAVEMEAEEGRRGGQQR